VACLLVIKKFFSPPRRANSDATDGRTLRTVMGAYLLVMKKVFLALFIWIEFVFSAATQSPVTTFIFAIALNIVILWSAPYFEH
jgi:hypothetical protein